VTSASFGAICGPLRRPLFIRALAMTRDRADADDLVQEAMLRAFESWADFRVESGCDARDRAGAWLHRILTNAFMTEHRQRARRARLAEQLEFDPGAMPATPPPPDDRLVGRALTAAISSLSPAERDTVLRVALRGEKPYEVARTEGLTFENARKRLFRGRRRLAAMVGTPQ
jgi:RNA polymerase sigma-70 factor, ECF subfamily